MVGVHSEKDKTIKATVDSFSAPSLLPPSSFLLHPSSIYSPGSS